MNHAGKREPNTNRPKEDTVKNTHAQKKTTHVSRKAVEDNEPNSNSSSQTS
jgi:hypothetical protein